MHDEEVERYLVEFKPRPVRALRVPRRSERISPLWLGAAAILFFVGGVSLWHLRQETKSVKDAVSRRHALPSTALRSNNLNAIALTKLALDHNEQFEALLADRSQTALPSFQGENSTLRVLARE